MTDTKQGGAMVNIEKYRVGRNFIRIGDVVRVKTAGHGTPFWLLTAWVGAGRVRHDVVVVTWPEQRSRGRVLGNAAFRMLSIEERVSYPELPTSGCPRARSAPCRQS